jgi:hypothetical protein
MLLTAGGWGSPGTPERIVRIDDWIGTFATLELHSCRLTIGVWMCAFVFVHTNGK